jgi:hypothetical protein
MQPIRLIPFTAAVATLALLGAGAKSASSGDDEQEIRASIEAFLADPVNAGDDVKASIVGFAEQSKTVEIVVDEQLVTWMKTDPKAEPYAGELILLAAYIAGNVRSQLDSGVTRSDDYSGLVQVLRAYRALKAADAELYSDADLDKLLGQQAKGELLTRCASVEKKRGDKKK